MWFLTHLGDLGGPVSARSLVRALTSILAMASRLGLNLFNAICISNTDISNNKYRYLYLYVIRDICN